MASYCPFGRRLRISDGRFNTFQNVLVPLSVKLFRGSILQILRNSTFLQNWLISFVPYVFHHLVRDLVYSCSVYVCCCTMVAGRKSLVLEWNGKMVRVHILITHCTALHIIQVSVYTLMKHRQLGGLSGNFSHRFEKSYVAWYMQLFRKYFIHTIISFMKATLLFILSGKKSVAYLAIRT